MGNWNFDSLMDGGGVRLDVSKIVEQMTALEEQTFRDAVIAKLRSLGYSVTHLDDEEPKRVPRPDADDEVTVYYYDHTCEWISKYCDEHHRRHAVIPVDVLAKYV
jgi:hypothetical protein